MLLIRTADLLKRRPKHRMNPIRVITRHRQPTALLGPVRRKRRHHHVPPRLHTAQHLHQISIPRRRLRQEMKDRTVMPKINTLIRQQRRTNITHNPIHRPCPLTKPRPTDPQRRIRKVNHRHIAVPSIQKVIHKRRSTTANIDNPRIKPQPTTLDKR